MQPTPAWGASVPQLCDGAACGATGAKVSKLETAVMLRKKARGEKKEKNSKGRQKGKLRGRPLPGQPAKRGKKLGGLDL